MHQGATSKSKRPLGGVFSTGAALASVASSVRVGQQLPGQTGKHILKRRIFFLEKSTCFKFSQVQPLGWKTNYTSYQVSRPGSLWKMSLELQMSSVFFCVVAPIHWETDLREAYASLRGVKGSLRGGVLFGVAYAGGYARIFRQRVWGNQLWGNFVYPRNGFISFHFGLLWKCLDCVWFVLLRGQWLLPSYLPKRGGPMAGALSCLRETYAEVTRRLRGGSW